MKRNRIIYLTSTIIFSALILFSAGMYFLKYAEVKQVFTQLGYPAYIIIPLGIAKILGLIAIWFSQNKKITEWAYAGFFFNLILAFFAHIMVNDGGFAPAFLGMMLLLASYFFRNK